MKRKLLFFINPISGTRSKDSLEKLIIEKCEKENAFFEILFTNREGNYDFLAEKVQSQCITDVVICGGDGSVSPVIAGLLNVPVNVGIIPLGSGNGLARTAGIPYNTEKAIEILFTGTPGYVDAFTVNKRLGCQIAGLGFDAFIAKEFARERKRGLSTYTKLAVKHFFKAKAYSFELSFEDETLGTMAFIVCVSNANQFGNNLKIAPKASLNDGKLDIVILKSTSRAQILSAFVNHLLFPKKTEPRNLGGKKNKIIYFHTSRLTIKNNELAPIHIDGDPLDPVREYEIEILPEAYKLIQPL